MKDAFKRIIDQIYPELKNMHHLPRFAQVVNVRETPNDGHIADPFRPYYAVDLQVLDEHGQPDRSIPILHDVPLPAVGAGHEKGQFSYPENGTRVEVAFAYGSPNQPFIRSILPHNLSLPAVDRGEQRWQHNASSYQRVDNDGNWQTQTDGNIVEDSLKRIISALQSLETYTQSIINIEADTTETVGGTKRVDAMGAVVVNSGGRLDFGALGDVHITGSTKQELKSPKTWIGSDAENVLGILSEFMAQMINLCNTVASHTHTNVKAGVDTSGSPTQSSAISGYGTNSNNIKTRLDNIKE